MEHGEKTMTIVDEQGNEHVCEVILTFDSPQPEKFDRSYVVYHVLSDDKEQNDDDQIEIHASAFIPSETGDGDLLPIESDEEWDMVEEVVGAFLDEEDEE